MIHLKLINYEKFRYIHQCISCPYNFLSEIIISSSHSRRQGRYYHPFPTIFACRQGYQETAGGKIYGNCVYYIRQISAFKIRNRTYLISNAFFHACWSSSDSPK